MDSFNRTDFLDSLKTSGLKSYELLVDKYTPFSSFEKSTNKLGKFAFFTKSLNNKYLTDVVWTEAAASLRPMKSCILTYFTAIAFVKHSAYQELFDRYVER